MILWMRVVRTPTASVCFPLDGRLSNHKGHKGHKGQDRLQFALWTVDYTADPLSKMRDVKVDEET